MKTLLCSLLLSFSAFAFSSDIEKIDVPFDRTNFIVKLASNPSTGYQWNIDKYDEKVLLLKSKEFIASNTSRVGAPGEMRFSFALINAENRPKATEILFKYSRAWEKDSAILKKVVINFNSN